MQLVYEAEGETYHCHSQEVDVPGERREGAPQLPSSEADLVQGNVMISVAGNVHGTSNSIVPGMKPRRAPTPPQIYNKLNI